MKYGRRIRKNAPAMEVRKHSFQKRRRVENKNKIENRLLQEVCHWIKSNNQPVKKVTYL